MKAITSSKLSTILTLAVAVAGLIFSGCDSSDKSKNGQLVIFAAASTTNAINDIAKEFTNENGIEVISNFASSSALAQQIENGAEADIYISANQKWADYLADKGFCQQKENIVANRIVIITPANSKLDLDSPEILLSPAIVNIAMGDPAGVPAGKYGKEALAKLGLWDIIADKVSAAKDVRSALAYVETEAAEAGIVYSTDAAISEKVKVVYLFPEDATAQPISYPAMTLKNSANIDNAKLFLEYLKSEAAKEIFKSYGFITD